MTIRKVKRVIYTVIFNDYDILSPINVMSECDFICFTDNKNLSARGWIIMYIPNEFSSEKYINRLIKIQPHLFLSDYDESLYIDGNIIINKNPDTLFDKYLNHDMAIALPKHPFRNCLYQEATYLLDSKRFSLLFKEKLRKQISRYRNSFLPENIGLTENNLILRKHNCSQIKDLSILWWNEFLSGCDRDQISLPYAIWIKSIPFSYIKEGPRFNNYFNINLHKAALSNFFIINYLRRIRFLSSKLSFLNIKIF
jgi:hypothetical protein